MVVEDLKDLEISISVHLFQIYLKIFLVMMYLVEEEDLEEDLQNRGNDLRYDITVGLEEAYTGINKKINYTTYKKCSRCSGQGAEPGSKPKRCDYCNGHGKVRSSQGFFTIQQTCPECSGYGETISSPCNQCSGNGKIQSQENVSVKIPKGVDDGTRIRLSGKEAGTKVVLMEIYIYLSQ